jgi:methylated-DNA-[protein]-cysteine S-methyltransferase
MSARVYWSPIESRFGNFAAWVDGRGRLIRFHFRAKGAARVDRDAIEDEAALADIQQQIAEYDAGTRKSFDVVRAAQGSAFQHRVWDALWEIPYGETTSYGAIAKQLGLVNGARAVGLANGQNPLPLIVPCHRVIGADGSLTGFGGGLPLKKALLGHEAAHSVREGDLFSAQS